MKVTLPSARRSFVAVSIAFTLSLSFHLFSSSLAVAQLAPEDAETNYGPLENARVKLRGSYASNTDEKAQLIDATITQLANDNIEYMHAQYQILPLLTHEPQESSSHPLINQYLFLDKRVPTSTL